MICKKEVIYKMIKQVKSMQVTFFYENTINLQQIFDLVMN